MKLSLVAGGTIASCRFMKRSGASGVIQAASSGTKCCGISPEWMKLAPGLTGSDNTITYESGDSAMVYGDDEEVLLTSGAAFSAGVELMTDGDGKAVTATAGQWVGAIARVAATAADQKILVLSLGDNGYYIPAAGT